MVKIKGLKFKKIKVKVKKGKYILLGKLSCNHNMVYDGAINVVIKGEVNGTIDVWKCKKCGMVYADSRSIGEPKLPDKVGMGSILNIERWGVLVCENGKGIEWHLVQTGQAIDHKCSVFDQCEVAIDSEGNIKCSKDHVSHRFYFIYDKLNKNVVI